ncbi:MAG: agmatine deiminase family protein [Rhodobacteraceae bacterium]|nr:agmatine deiminase family protein [Paracoccaceae bacterium]
MTRRTLLATSAAACAASPARAAPRLYVPPEEAPHQRCFMMWPTSRKVYPDRFFLDLLQDSIADIASTIAAFEPVTLLAHRDEHRKIRRKTSAAVTLWDIPTEDLWTRDAGPLFARTPDGGLAVSHIQFNGWGGKQLHARDGAVAAEIARRLGLPLIDSGLAGEAGGVEHDGHSRLIAHTSSWLGDDRNPGLSQDQIGARLMAAYGAEHITWAPGVRGDDITDYHIDSLARFTAPGRILINLPDTPDPADPFHRAARDTHDRLRAAGFEIDVIPEPVARRVDAIDFVASYVNYFACNGAVIAAQFGDPETDAIASEALAHHYPGREVVMLNTDALGEVGGGIHCATQQMPA